MADSHDSQVYRELLTQFRDGFAGFGKASLHLEGFTTTEPVVLPEDERECLLKEIGNVSWPIGPPGQRDEQSFQVWGSLAHPHHTGKPEVHEFSLEALNCFCLLAERAGAHLPRSLLDSLPSIPYLPAPDAASRWYRLLWWLPVVDHSATTVSFSPFEDSVRAIEACGLAGDSPAFPFRVVTTNDGDIDVVVEADTGRKSLGNSEAAPTVAKPGVNARMLEAIQENMDSMGWSSTKWATHLECAKSSVVTTQAWKDLAMGREREKAQRALDRRRRPRGSDLSRD